MDIMSTLDLNQELIHQQPSPPDARRERLRVWAESSLQRNLLDLAPASADASFRRYFRLTTAEGTLIAMDAPPEREDCRPFVDVTNRLLNCGVNAPRILHANIAEGYLLLDDLGSTTYLEALGESTAEALYEDAFRALLLIQRADATHLPVYDHALLCREMSLFRDWFLEKRLGIQLGPGQIQLLDSSFDELSRAILEQPRCFVHRDYHSRNLMVTTENNPGVLDYQDAVLGPVTYDLMSLMRDAYISWPRERMEAWVQAYGKRAMAQGLWPQAADTEVIRWFDLMGAQRFLKVIGIFSRLWLRDGKSRYLADIPRVYGYLAEVLPRYVETRGLLALLDSLGIPKQLA